MKWDYATVVKWGLDQDGPDGVNLFTREVVALAKTLGADVEPGDKINGYQEACNLVRGDQVMCRCLTGGTGSSAGSSLFQAEHTAAEVYPVLQDMFPRHSVSRLDACEDFSGDGTWDKLEMMLTTICAQHRVSMAPFGEGHWRPDGSRDATKGRSWYCGSKSSPFRIVLYEKGLQMLAMGIPADPTWVRLEVRIRPSSKAKEQVGTARLLPSDLLGMSRWGVAVGQALGAGEVRRMAIGSVWKPSEREEMALKIVRMFDRGMDQLLDQVGTPEEVGRLLYAVHQKYQVAKATKGELKSVEA